MPLCIFNKNSNLIKNINKKLPKEWFNDGLTSVESNNNNQTVIIPKKFYKQLLTLYEEYRNLRFNILLINNKNIEIDIDSDKWFVEGVNGIKPETYDSKIILGKKYFNNLVNIYTPYQNLFKYYNDNVAKLTDYEALQRKIQFEF